MDFSQLKALVVDDDSGICDVLRSYLEFKGIFVEIATNLREIKEVYKEQKFNFIFLDYYLPDGQGIDLLKKGFFKKEKIFIVLMTGHFHRDMVRDTVKLGVNDFLIKPFGIKEIDTVLFKAKEFIDSFYNFKDAVKLIRRAETEIVIGNDVTIIKAVTKIISRNLVEANFFDDALEIELALSETLANAIYHGNLELDSMLKNKDFSLFEEEAEKRMNLPPYKDRKVYLKSCFDKEKFTVKIKDEGNGFDWKNKLERTTTHTLEPFGRGIFLINSIFDKVSWNEKGNEITLIKYKKH